MKNPFKVTDLIDDYKKWVKNGEIQFLEDNTTEDFRNFLNLLDILKEENENKTSDDEDWFKIHETGRKLWHNLISKALNYIDKTSKGNSELFEYLDVSSKFEDLLYGVDDYYRDHMIHSLWVYFIGEHIMRKHLPEIHGNRGEP